MSLNNKIALVTGGAQGIGLAIAEELAESGATLVIADVNLEKAEETAKELSTKFKKDMMAIKMDVSSLENVDQCIKKIIDKYTHLDILINNAGVTRDGLLMRMNEADWDLVMNINLKGTFNCIKSATRPMMKQRSGRMINIASVVGLMGNAGQANYSASKAGVIGLTKTAAKELASRGVTVNAIAPGFIKTAMTDKLTEDVKNTMQAQIPLGRFGEAKDVAKAVCFLASDDATYITGQVLTVDGGMVMH